MLAGKRARVLIHRMSHQVDDAVPDVSIKRGELTMTCSVPSPESGPERVIDRLIRKGGGRSSRAHGDSRSVCSVTNGNFSASRMNKQAAKQSRPSERYTTTCRFRGGRSSARYLQRPFSRRGATDRYFFLLSLTHFRPNPIFRCLRRLAARADSRNYKLLCLSFWILRKS